MNSANIFLNYKLICISFLALLCSLSFAQDLHPSHNAYNSLTSVVDAMKLERTSCAEIGYYPQVGQAICASVTKADTFRTDWDLIVSNTGASFGLSPLGDWTSEPARGIIHRTYLLGTTDLMVNYDVISSRITIDVLDPELKAQEEARRTAQAQAEAAQQQAQQQAQVVYDTYNQQPYNQQQASAQTGYDQTASAQTGQTTQTVNGYDVSAAYPTQQAQPAANGYVATNADGTTFVLADSSNTTNTNTVVTTPQVVTTQTAATQYNTATVETRGYAPASPEVAQQTVVQSAAVQSAVVQSASGKATVQTGTSTGYASTAASNYAQAPTENYQAVAQTSGTQAVAQAVTHSTAGSTIAYAYTPTNLLTTMGSTTQNSTAFQPNGAWQITSSGNPVTIELYDSATRSYLRTVYPDQIYTDAGNYYLSINGNAAWALSVWTE